MIERRLEKVHFQITRNCNLHCWFCGQWGKKGFFSTACGEEMTLNDWLNVINSLIKYRHKTGVSPIITIWGGEPLVSPFFDKILSTLKNNDFSVEIVTNGTMLDKHNINGLVDRVYVSIDGDRKIHDSIRGEGVFDKVIDNLSNLKDVKISVMSVLTKELLEIIDVFSDMLKRANPDEIIFQQMIVLNKEEIESYKQVMKKEFGINAQFINSWFSEYEIVGLTSCPPHCRYIPHKNTGICLSPFRHTHVAWNGEVTYCTDFYDFSAGNVKREDLIDIFSNEKSEKFRNLVENNKLVTCNHCSWRSHSEYNI